MTSPLPIVENIWTVRAPQTFLGLHVGTQMTIVRLTGGGLVLHSPVAITPELKAQIDALGPVRHVICPAMFHHLHAGSAIAAWPQARLHAPEALQRKRRDLRFDAVFGEVPHPDWAGDLVAITIDGSLLGETVLYHKASKTLITVDLVENFSHCDHAPTRWYLKLGGIYGRPGWHPLLRATYLNRRKARASIQRILALPFERVLVAHGDNIEHDAGRVIREGLRWLL
ncbi:MAG: DUF4336 domain-containing protein [Sinimarinibacterium flocculans]|uniref:DUF4336 domain-containing protein n=1 Tax=Sinimarinibacterium flocculans TaxID=985250 RepID=UPI003C647038